MEFGVLTDLFNRLEDVSDNKAWAFAMDKETKDDIIQMNTVFQMEQDGVDSLGLPIGDYSNYTIAIKKRNNQRYDHITLKDTGDFYESFEIVVLNDGFTINANPIKDEDNLFSIYGVDILGLTPENMTILSDLIATKYIKYINEQLL